MSDLAEFLLARIAEDEAVARAATSGPWEFADVSDGWDGRTLRLETVAKEPPYSDGSVGPVDVVLSGWGYDASGISVSDEDAAHIARWDPVRALAECEGKRRIVDIVESWRVGGSTGAEMLRCLALPYTLHPDYRAEWKL